MVDAVQPEEAASTDSPVQENENAPEAVEDVAPAPAPAAPDFPSVPMPETAETNEAAMPEAPVKEEGPAAPAADMTQEEPLPQQETADAAAAAPADDAAETLSDEMDSTDEAGAKAVADTDVTPPARDEAAAVPPSAPAFPAPAREAAAEQTLPADDVQTGDASTDAAEAPVSDAVQPEEAASADSPVQESENAPEAAEYVAPAPAPAAPDFPSVPVAETAETNEAAMPEAPTREEDTSVPATDMTQEEPLPQQETADAAPADVAAEALSDEMDSTDEADAETVADTDVTPSAQDEAAAVPPSAPAFPAPAREAAAEQALPADDVQTGDAPTDAAEAPMSDAVQPEEAASADSPVQESENAPEAAASPLAGGYVSPSLRHAGEWVGEPMPIGTPVDRPAPRQEETVSAPVETVGHGPAPWRRDASPDEIARKLGKPSLAPTDKSALITPQPRKSSSTGPGAGTQPALPRRACGRGAPGRARQQGRFQPAGHDAGQHHPSCQRPGRDQPDQSAAANTLMRFLSRFHTGNGQPQDKEEARSRQAPAATAQERQGTPRPMPQEGCTAGRDAGNHGGHPRHDPSLDRTPHGVPARGPHAAHAPYRPCPSGPSRRTTPRIRCPLSCGEWTNIWRRPVMPWNSGVCIWWPTPPDAWPPRPKATVSGYWAAWPAVWRAPDAPRICRP